MSLGRRSPLRRVTPLRSSTPLERQTPLRGKTPLGRGRRRPTPAPSVTELFRETVCSKPCIGRKTDEQPGIPGHVCDGPLQAMHVVPKRTLKSRGLAHLVWDPINGIAGCESIHRRHDLAIEKIPRELLPARCFEWAWRNGVLASLERHWPADRQAGA